MANKKVALEVDVQSSGLDDTITKVDKLNNSIKQTELTTKDFGRNVKIEYDKAGNATDVLVDKELNLTKQIRAVKGQMEILTATGKAQSQEFTVLQRKFNDLNDNLAKNKARSQELFGTLSLLPGPVGQFSASLQGGIDLLKTFSGVRLTDLKNQFEAVGDDLKEIFKGFSEFNSKPIQTPQQPGTPTTPGGTTTAVAGGAGGLTQVSEAIDKESDARKNRIEAMTKEGQTLKNLTVAQRDELKTITEGKIGIEKYTLTKDYLAKQSEIAKNALKSQTVATNTLSTAETIATTATTILKAALAALGIGLLISGIVALGSALINLIKPLLGFEEETKKNIAATDAFTAAIKREADALNLDLQAIDISTKSLQTRAKIANKSEQEITDIAIKGGEDRLQALKDYDNHLFVERMQALHKDGLTSEQRNKLLADLDEKYLKNGQAINKQILDNEQIRLDGLLALQLKYYNDSLAELDAKIQLEIDKDKTGGERLQKLIDERAKKVIEHEHLYGKAAEAQRELMRKNGLKKTQDALDEDTKRVQAYQSRVGDIYNAAILDNQLRDETARKKKLNDDINAIKLDTEFRKKGIIEQEVILKELELGYENDLVKIRETYFLKRLQKIDEQKTLEIQKKKQQNDNLLALDQQYLIEGQDGIFGEALLHTKKYLEDRFVDMRSAAQVEHDSTDYQLTQELDQLKQAYDQKNLTQQEYESKVAETNKRIYDNNQQLFDKNRQLDALEISAKKETAAATLQVAEAAVSVLSALSSQSEDLAIAAALADAGLGIAKIIISTQVAIAEFSASVAALGPVGVAMASAYAIKQKIAAGLGIAAITIGAIGKINSIKKGGASGGTSGGGEDTINRGKNYGEGGMIDGPRHAQGGVPVNAEGGEAIMTRGAVTMFAPLLSMMNQAGGGVSFSKGAVGQANFDKPNTQSTPTEQPIIRTYVVENEMTTTQHRAARLKSLSTL